MTEERIVETRESNWHLPALIVLGLIAIGGLAFGWNASSKLDSTQQSVANQIKAEQQSEQQDVAALRDRLAQDEKANADLQGDLKVVTDKLKLTQGQLKKAREESSKLNDATAEKLTALDTSVKCELATKATADDVKTVDTEVVAVKTDGSGTVRVYAFAHHRDLVYEHMPFAVPSRDGTRVLFASEWGGSQVFAYVASN